MVQIHESNTKPVPPKESVFWIPLDTHTEAPFNIEGRLCLFSSEPVAVAFLTLYPDGQKYVKKCTWGSIVEMYKKDWKRAIVDCSLTSDTETIFDIET
jgi:hypothetical protein